MPQSLSRVIVHLVFSTKERRPFLDDRIRANVHAYLATVTRNAGCDCLRVGGTEDHVHLAIHLGRTIMIAALVERLKTASSKWLKAQATELSDFAWQRGYGCFSVSPNDIEPLVHYIDNQHEHHVKHSFQDEFRKLLNKSGVEFDEKYLWD